MHATRVSHAERRQLLARRGVEQRRHIGGGLAIARAPLEAVELGATGDDVLVGTREIDGHVFRIDPSTGAATQIGDMGGAFSSSGDIVTVDGFGTVQTVPGANGDQLARLADGTFAATGVGTGTGYTQIWGLAFWKNTIYGFTSTGDFLLIDPTSGVAQLVSTSAQAWWGAAVTTVAPVIE